MMDREAVLATLDEYADAYCTKDIKRLMAVFDDGDDITLIGTGADEFCTTRSAVENVFRRNFAEATATRFEWQKTHVTVFTLFAVVAVSVTIHLRTRADPLLIPVRWTVAMIRRSSGWRWLHRHASSAAATQEKGTAYPNNK